MESAYPERFFLHLMDSSEEIDLKKDILESPLGLASKVIEWLFEEKFEELRNELDEIKQFVAGIDRAQKLSSNYPLASYYSSMFAFHQHVHSSFRARQGKVLEKMIQNVLKQYGRCDEVPGGNDDRLSILRGIFDGAEFHSYDIDAMGISAINKKTIIIQLRSRDDTGGTTAKGSLVDLLRELLQLKKIPQSDILYLVCIWDPREAQQRNSTINKMFSALQHLITVSEKEFYGIVEKKVELQENISLKMAYGTDEIAHALLEWIGDKNEEVLTSIPKVVGLISDWDDLWISYAIASLELEVATFSGSSNVRLLNKYYDKIGLRFNFESYQNLTESIHGILQEMIPLWTEDSIPLSSMSGKAQYIRDLLFLKAHYEKDRDTSEQLPLFSINDVIDTSTAGETDEQVQLISFRELVPEIKDTGYLTHSIFYYPAKFIPQVVRYALKSFTNEGDWVVDPFAGSGTVGVEAYLCQRNAFLLDLNPLLDYMIPLKVPPEKERLREDCLSQMLDGLERNDGHFTPAWSNIAYWYPPEMLEVLSRYWGFIKNSEHSTYTAIIQSALLKASKHFSYAEHRTPKLFRSKSKRRYVEELLQTDWEEKLKRMIRSHSLETIRSMNDFAAFTSHHNNRVEFSGGVDSSYYSFQREFNALITSPPYLQAQEYMRTVKMELFWLGYNDEEIRKLSRLEIPYRKADRVIQTPTLEKIRSELTRADLTKLLDSYFCHTINALENAMNQLKANGTACIFIGNPLIDGIKVEIWRILMEYFTDNGYSFENLYEDRIKNRQLFGTRKNKNPDGMKSEFLLILRKG